MKTIIATLFALLVGVALGVRWAYAEQRRWIIRGDRLPY